jgi:hypothetical protein
MVPSYGREMSSSCLIEDLARVGDNNNRAVARIQIHLTAVLDDVSELIDRDIGGMMELCLWKRRSAR